MRLDLDPSLMTPSSIDAGLWQEAAYVSGSAEFQRILQSGIEAARNGDRLEARRLLFQASGIDPRCEDVWMWLASISDYPEELLIFLNNALDINPENRRATEWRAATRSLLAKTFVQRAIAVQQEGSTSQAEQCIAQALAYDIDCEIAWFWRASLAESEEKKLEFLERVLEINPENDDARNAINAIMTARSNAVFGDAKSAAVAGRRKKAFELVSEFLRSEPNNADAWILKSHLALGLDEKIEALERALEIDPSNPAARSGYDFLTATVGSTREQQEVVTPAENAVDEPVEESPAGSEEFAAPDAQPAELRSDEVLYQENNGHSELDLSESHGSYDLESANSESGGYSEAQGTSSDESEIFGEAAAAEERAAATDLEVLDVPVQAPSASFDPYVTREFSVEDEYEIRSEFAEAGPSEPSTNASYDLEPASEQNGNIEEGLDALHLCPFCRMPNKPKAFACDTCHAVLSLSDIELLLNNPRADRETVQNAVTQMEAEWNLRDFSETELTDLGIGYFNLGHHEEGVKYIQEASRANPNNVILAAQLNTLAIRMDENRRQSEVHEALPKGKTILVVDDSSTVRKLIAGKLEKSGHRVICAEDGVEALQCLDAELPDLVLLDITMPRMDGYEVCKKIRANPAAKDLPVVMISGKDGFFDKVRGRMAGTTGYVTKPFGPETLMKALETYLLPDPVAA